SGDLDLHGTRGPARLESVSGGVNIEDVQGPMRIKSVSGGVEITHYAGSVEGSSGSGDVDLRRRVHGGALHTVRGGFSLDAEPEGSTDSETGAETDQDPERTAPMAPPPTAKVRELLERLARGEVSVDDVAARLDETRRNF